MSGSSKRTLVWSGVAVVVVGVLLALRLQPAETSGLGGGVEEETALPVEVRRMAPRPLVERLATTGTLAADEQVDLRSEIAGTVAAIHFEEGLTTRRGALLVKIDDEEFVAERDRARYRAELAEQRESRQHDLLRQKLISQDDYDITLSQRNVLQAELRLAETALAKTEIRAPFDGLLGFRAVSPGARISPATTIVRLQRVDPIKVEFTVPEQYAGAIRLGEAIEFQVKGTSERHSAVIYAIEPQLDPGTRSLRARARSANPHGSMLPGAFADVEVVVSAVDDALTVPSIAVIPELGGKKVFVIEGGRAVSRIVETGIRTDTEVQVVRGLEIDDEVIVSGVQRLVSGLKVEPRSEVGAEGVAP